MTTTYYHDPRSGTYRVERRVNHAHIDDNRRQGTTTTSQVQYEFLRDCLLRREAHRRELGKKERRARHILVGITATFVALLFAASDDSSRSSRLWPSHRSS